jgi:hypothetical protein
MILREPVRKFLAGEFTPPETPSRPPGKGYSKTTLSVTFPETLREEVRAVLPDRSKQAGYRITESSIALSWLLSELGVSRPGEGTEKLELQLPRPLRDHLVQAAAAQGVEPGAVVEAGFRDLVSGAWSMPKPERAPYGSQSGLKHGKLPLWVDAGLLAEVSELAPRLADEFGVKVGPTTIAIAVLKNRLGEPAE